MKKPGAAFYWLVVIATLCTIAFVVDWIDGGWNFPGLIALLFAWSMAVLSYRITTHQVVRSDAHDNGHHGDTTEGAKYTCIHLLPPDDITGECSWPRWHNANCPEPTAEERKIKVPKPKA